MSGTLFTETDAGMIYTAPRCVVSLGGLFVNYTLINRCAVPTYEETRLFLEKALATGAFTWLGDVNFRIDETWFERAHQWDVACDDEFEAIEGFPVPLPLAPGTR